MTATNTNKQPVFVDRPLIRCVRITNQTVGDGSNLNVLGGQTPAILVDMDASLSSDNNSGGVIDAIRITRDNTNTAQDPSYTVNTATSGEFIGLKAGQVVFVQETGVLNSPPANGVGYYTYTGAVSSGNINTSISYNIANGFSYISPGDAVLPPVTFVFYLTEGTTVPIPADGDYKILFSKTVPTNVNAVDCTDQMAELATPVPVEGNTAGIGDASPLRNRSVYLQRGQRLYVGVQQEGSFNTISGYIPGAHITAQGGFY